MENSLHSCRAGSRGELPSWSSVSVLPSETVLREEAAGDLAAFNLPKCCRAQAVGEPVPHVVFLSGGFSSLHQRLPCGLVLVLVVVPLL